MHDRIKLVTPNYMYINYAMAQSKIRHVTHQLPPNTFYAIYLSP